MVTDRTVISLFIPDNDYCLYSGQLRSRQSTGPDGLICNASWVTGDSGFGLIDVVIRGV